jgi:hypothetical protein
MFLGCEHDILYIMTCISELENLKERWLKGNGHNDLLKKYWLE